MPTSRARLAVALWLLAMAGVVSVTVTVVPQLIAHRPASIPLPLVLTLSLIQSAVFATLAIWAGVALSAPVGLAAPTLEALARRDNAIASLRRQIVPAAIAELLCGFFLIALARITPPALQNAATTLSIPLAAKLLYGGITEEILLRWGLMTALLWLLWRTVSRRQGSPRAALVATAVLGSALLFGIGHLPAVVALGIPLTTDVIAFVVLGNLIPGIAFGGLYARHGLEAAMMAHALAHLVAA